MSHTVYGHIELSPIELEIYFMGRFVDKKTGPMGKANDGTMSRCWMWTGPTGGSRVKPNGEKSAGYGNFHWKGIRCRAHIVSYEHFYGKFSRGKGRPRKRRMGAYGELVLHSCDNGLCVNPAHLSLGTGSDNRRQALERGVANRKPNRLTQEQVDQIRGMIAAGLNNQEIGRQFGVADNTVSAIRNHHSWKKKKTA